MGSVGNRFNGLDDETPTEGVPIGHPDNREALAFLGNDVIELREHTRVIQTLYEAIRAIQFPIGVHMASQLIGEYERHHAANAQNLVTLRSIAAK